jgi:hypothetical protein
MQCREVVVPISHRRQKHREEEELVDLSSSHVEDAPQKHDCRSSPEQMNSRMAAVSEADFFFRNSKLYFTTRIATLLELF